jgi:hypothetical protein
MPLIAGAAGRFADVDSRVAGDMRWTESGRDVKRFKEQKKS